jgi:hypothetical protein
MITALSTFMRKSKIFIEIFNAEQKQFEQKELDLEDLRKQMDIETATWGLDIYEKDLGIKTDRSKPLTERRSVIKSKERGSGKVDATLIKLVADSFTNGDVEVTFDGQINIKFTSVLGIPPNLEDLENALEDVKPAHLAIAYAFAYLLIKDIHGVMTLTEIEQKPLNLFAGGA